MSDQNDSDRPYRVYKLNEAGRIIKGKDMLAPNDEAAMHQACEDPECPICEVWRGTAKVGNIS